MSDSATATIRELRLDFRSIKRKVEQFGEIVITDNGVPSYILRPAPAKRKKHAQQPDYWARLQKREAKPLNAEATKSLHRENRGDR